MSISSGTLVCMRKASSYCAMRVAISGLCTSASLRSIEPADRVDDVLLLRAIDAGRIADVVHRVALRDRTGTPWKRLGRKPLCHWRDEIGCGSARAGAAGEHDEAGQVVRFAAEAVGDPRAHAGPAGDVACRCS